MKASFIIEGKAKGKDRPRFAGGHAYTAPATKEYEDRVKFEYARQCRNYRFDGAVSVEITVFEEPKKSCSKKEREKLIGTPAVGKPDTDNVAKIIMDALNGVAFIDDKQVAVLKVYKIYGNSSKVDVEITEAVK